MRSTANSLGMFRIAFYGALFLIYFGLDVRPWTHVSSAFWMPVSVFRFLSGPPRDTFLVGILQIVWKISLAFAAAGLMTRLSAFVSAGLGIYLLGLSQNFGKIEHIDGIIVILLCVLSVSRSGDALSLDCVLLRRPAAAEEDFEYRWPLLLGQTLFTLVFFAAGVAKLRVSGFGWMTADNMRNLLIQHQYTHIPPTGLGPIMARATALCAIAAVGTVAIELSMPLAVFIRRLRFPLLAALLTLQTGIALTMGVYFTPYLAGYLLFLPWESWSARFLTRSRLTAPDVSGGTRTARPA